LYFCYSLEKIIIYLTTYIFRHACMKGVHVRKWAWSSTGSTWSCFVFQVWCCSLVWLWSYYLSRI